MPDTKIPLNQEDNFSHYPKLRFPGNTENPTTTGPAGPTVQPVTQITFLRPTNQKTKSKGAGMQSENVATNGPQKPLHGQVDTSSEDYRRDCLARFLMRQGVEQREFILERVAPSLRADTRSRMLAQFAEQLMALDPEQREARLARIRFNARKGERHRTFADEIEARVRQVQKAEGGDYGRRA